ncbi:DUF4007 family protein [Acrocarpospora sp. B8E8]|uniref:DUF4007 family protein n=1 Tax=Acrocarpospora sp. B8E8 TaxID=3153572 RepID=UPI00325DABFD
MSDSRLAEAAHPSFARHETFAPRFGWLHKAYMQVKTTPGTFLAPDAPVLLGVGKNMVNAMRYWSKAFKLTREHHGEDPGSRAMVASPTWEARWLLDEDGADPYLEETGSLWLLHWWLLSSRPSARSWAPSWYVAFHLAPFARFTIGELTQVIVRHVNFSYPEGPVEASIVKDVECITKMYARDHDETSGAPGAFEDLLACPFRELGLLEFVGQRGKREWRFTSAARTSLPPRVLAYACLDYAARDTQNAGSVSLARLANEPGGPGRAFRIREIEIAAALEKVASQHPRLGIVEAVGQRSLTFACDPNELAWEILDKQYDQVSQRPSFPDRNTWSQRYPGLAEAGKRENKQKDSAAPTDQPLVLIEESA